MANTEHLPIYKGCYDLCLYLEQVVHHFSRYQKYTLGSDLRDGARRALRLVVRANARRDKIEVLLALREQFEELKVVLRLGQDVKAFANFNTFAHATGQVVSLRQIWGQFTYSSFGVQNRLNSVPRPFTHTPNAG